MTVYIEQTPPLLAVENNTAYSCSGNVIYCYKLELKEAYSCSEAAYDEIHSIWHSAFKLLVPGTIIHKQDIFLRSKYDTSVLPTDNYLQKATARHFESREKTEHFSYLFFMYPDSELLNAEHIKNPFKKMLTIKEVKKENEKREIFYGEVRKCTEFINSSHLLSVNELEKEEIEYLSFAYFNGFYHDRVTECSFDPRESLVGDKQIGIFSLNNLKQFQCENLKNCIKDDKMSSDNYTYFKGFSEDLSFGIECDHIYNQVIFIKDHIKERNILANTQKNLYGARKFSKENEVNSIKVEKYLDTLYDDDSARLVYAHNNVIFLAKDRREYKQTEEQVSGIFKRMDIIPFYPTKDNKINLFINSFFGFTSALDINSIYGPIDLNQPLCLFNNITNYKEDLRGIILNERLFNTPVKIDIWDSEKKYMNARNFFILAPTGEGKSVLAQHIFRLFYEEGKILVIVDLGGSYRKLSALYPDSAYIRYEEGRSLGINPFAVKGETELTIGKIEVLTNYVFKHYIYERLPSAEEAVSMRKIIRSYYNTAEGNYSFPGFVKFVDQYKHNLLNTLEIKDEFFNIDQFLHNCKEYIGDGVYAHLYNSDTEIEDLTNKRLIVFELDELKDNEKLLTIMLHLISDTIQNKIWKDKSTKGVVFFDEFAKMLKFPSVLSSVEYYSQAIRKQEGALGLVLQTPNQLPDTPGAKSIIENTQVLYVLNNEKGYKPIIDRFNLTEHDKNQLMSIRNNYNGKIRYSEFMLKRGSHSHIYRLELPKEVFYAYQTDGVDYENIMAIYKKTGNMETAINKYINQQQ